MYVYISEHFDDELIQQREDSYLGYIEVLDTLDESGVYLGFPIARYITENIAHPELKEQLLTGTFRKFIVPNSVAANDEEVVSLVLSRKMFEKINEAKSVNNAAQVMEEAGLAFSMKMTGLFWAACKEEAVEEMKDEDGYDPAVEIFISPWQER